MKSQRQCYTYGQRAERHHLCGPLYAVYVKSTVTLIISTLSYGRMILFLYAYTSYTIINSQIVILIYIYI